MIVINRNPLYKCEICGAISENKSVIEACEKKEKPIPLVNVGDIVYFKDCSGTPVLYGEEKSTSTHLFEDDSIGKTMRQARVFLNHLCKYKVKDIKIHGHEVEYILGGIKGESAEWNVSPDFEYWWHYPSIYGNDLMRKVLEEYNSK